jgi:hypothetical protein
VLGNFLSLKIQKKLKKLKYRLGQKLIISFAAFFVVVKFLHLATKEEKELV